jgi:hypothetical protein
MGEFLGYHTVALASALDLFFFAWQRRVATRIATSLLHK